MEFRKSKILIVEDEVLTGEELKQQLLDAKYDVCDVVYTGESAVERAEIERPDLIIMDIVLPGVMDGIQAAELIKSRFNIPIIYLTAYLDSSIVERAKYSSPYSYLSKPYKVKDLLAIVQVSLQKFEENGRLDKIVTNSIDKCVVKLQGEVCEMKNDIFKVKKIVDDSFTKIENLNGQFSNSVEVSIKKQFKDFFGDQKEHIIDHNFIKEKREGVKETSKLWKTSVISIACTIIAIILLYGIFGWHNTVLHKTKVSGEIIGEK